MTGFKNITDGIAHFFQRLGGEIEDDLKAVLAILHPSVVAVENAVKEHGPELIQAIAHAMAEAALAALATASGDAKEKASAAGQAAIAAGQTAAVNAGIELGKDVLHAIATAQVSAAQAG